MDETQEKQTFNDGKSNGRKDSTMDPIAQKQSVYKKNRNPTAYKYFTSFTFKVKILSGIFG